MCRGWLSRSTPALLSTQRQVDTRSNERDLQHNAADGRDNDARDEEPGPVLTDAHQRRTPTQDRHRDTDDPETRDVAT